MKSELGKMHGCGKMCGGMPCHRFCRRIKLTKNKREWDGAMAIGGHHKTGGHNDQLKVGVGHERGDCGRTFWWAFNDCLAAANEATKNNKIKIRSGLRWLQNDVKNTTINQKRATSMDGRQDGTKE